MFGDRTCDLIGFPRAGKFSGDTMIHDDSPFIKIPKQTRSLTARVDKVLPGSSGGERTDLNSNQILRGSRSNNDLGKKTT